MLGSFLIPLNSYPVQGLLSFLYLDPGSGSMIIQLIIAGILGALFLFRGYWQKLITKIRNPKEKEKDSDDHDEW